MRRLKASDRFPLLIQAYRSLDPIGLRLDVNGQANGMPQEQPYSTDITDEKSFEKELQWTYPSPEPDLSGGATIFLTGATGFLGAYILRELLSRASARVIALVRAPTEATGLARIKETCQAYDLWSNEWLTRLSCVVGDLAKAKLGLGTETWNRVADEADIVIHNGAKVHWVLPCKSCSMIDNIALMRECSSVSTTGHACGLTLLTDSIQTRLSNPQMCSAPSLQCHYVETPANPSSFVSSAALPC